MTRTWEYQGFTIESYPQGRHFKYVVRLAPDRLLASITLVAIMAELDTLGAKQ